MKLLIDLGNSRMKWAEMRDDRLDGYGSCSYHERENWPAALDCVDRPERVYFASVAADELNSRLEAYLQARWGSCAVRLFSQQTCCGVHNGYEQPLRLGVDRWAAMLAAYRLCRGPLCVIDCGSAMTVDALDGSGRHLGGLILPGVQLQQRSLLQGTARIGDAQGDLDTGRMWGRNSAACVQHGSVHAMAALVEHSARDLARQLPGTVKVVMTGGDALLIMSLLEREVVYEEHLVLQGMSMMVRQQEG
ncbi:MAG: type III pantothenate kinase [Gammaproteobacteria bacterium]|nr:type III pantothenate kinase [Gammaproteobacteria bacterium]MCW8839382.1 type III pantothenate kinase [Gammaproteobacteria bacterium]MCW8928035.1 type III pantothenate kinase [Gammaproteobacteria bacterium]MCW8958006.1 type III pantothenate kinase [Gammaproteobacteria bacterium]MCW8973808.1 type III pantothenate kinase [Gammaproteobacteria bacterium]